MTWLKLHLYRTDFFFLQNEADGVDIFIGVMVLLFVGAAFIYGPMFWFGEKFIEKTEWRKLFGGSNKLFFSKAEREQISKLDDIYDKEFAFYNLLLPAEKRKFIHRVITTWRDFTIQTYDGLELSYRDRAHLMGTLVKVTFGYNASHLAGWFHNLRIHPREFSSQFVNGNLKGLTYNKGTISLSWLHYLEGYADTQDKINLGIHEFAHMLKIECGHFEDYRKHDDWLRTSYAVIKSMREGKRTIFRDYGATNIDEFWAVCVETFFEAPVLFRSEHPGLYQHISELLRQDMAQRIQNSKFTQPGRDTPLDVAH